MSSQIETKNATSNVSFFDNPVSEITDTVPKQKFSGYFQNLDAQIETMMGRGKNVVKKHGQSMFIAYFCKVCGKEGQNNHIKSHIEKYHLEGCSIPCNFCDKAYRSRHALKQHVLRHQN